MHHSTTNDSNVRLRQDNVYLGPKLSYTHNEIDNIAAKYNAEVTDASQ